MAGGGSRQTGGKKKARIEIIPLIDVIFFLLATFILFTLSLNKSGGVKVNLPGAETSVPRDPSGTVTLSVTDTGSVAWDSEILPTLDQFIPKLQAYKLANPTGRILINGDKNAMYS